MNKIEQSFLLFGFYFVEIYRNFYRYIVKISDNRMNISCFYPIFEIHESNILKEKKERKNLLLYSRYPFFKRLNLLSDSVFLSREWPTNLFWKFERCARCDLFKFCLRVV